MKTMKYVILLSVLGLFINGCAGQQFHTQARIPSLTVHIVGDRSQLPGQYADNSLMGFMKGNEIWILGRKTPEGKIIINETLLGHEVAHVLQHQTYVVHNPDKPATW